ncbi:MAG: efflux RND transporter periplasmic adaptor subunit, partial [Xanthomonadaceae bacterium]|nr:efflux RND transporter periplasmic adaptor subunit [Xanthomonadaceae bacterium]
MSRPEDLLRDLRIDRRPGATPRRRRRWPWLVGAAALLGGLLVLAGGRPVPVEVATARAAADAGPP